MWRGEWRPADLRRYVRALGTDLQVRTRLDMRTFDGEVVATLHDRIIDGSVTLDLEADTTRMMQVSVLDPGFKLDLDSRSPAAGAVHFNRLLKAHLGFLIDDTWWDVPVFTGPVTGFARNAAQIDITCAGMEHLARGQVATPLTIPKGTPTVEAIKRIMRAAGERRFSMPERRSHRLGRPLSLWRNSSPWWVCRELAAALGMQLYYDGAGVLCLRDWPVNPCLELRDGPGGLLLGEVTASYELGDGINQTIVRGAAPKGVPESDKKRPEASATLLPGHVMSPAALARNGVSLFRRQWIDVDGVSDVKQLKAIADRELKKISLQQTQVEATCLPVPALDPGDVVRIATRDLDVKATVRQSTLPLVLGDQSIGFLKRRPTKHTKVRAPKTRWLVPYTPPKPPKGKGGNNNGGGTVHIR